MNHLQDEEAFVMLTMFQTIFRQCIFVKYGNRYFSVIVYQSSMLLIFVEANFYHFHLTSFTIYESNLRIHSTVHFFVAIYKFQLIMDVHLFIPKMENTKLLFYNNAERKVDDFQRSVQQ